MDCVVVGAYGYSFHCFAWLMLFPEKLRLNSDSRVLAFRW